MAGMSGIAVPAGLSSEGLPLGLRLIGRAFDEETLFSIAYVIEQSAPRSRRRKNSGRGRKSRN
jgi:aspartyl-tRNA(Asn)/glutamyl-tRNA(Gln) amidotransferase subunit A